MCTSGGIVLASTGFVCTNPQGCFCKHRRMISFGNYLRVDTPNTPYEREDRKTRTKTKRIDIRLSESELDALGKAAAKSKLSYSELIRRLILNCRIIEAPPVDYYDLICELRHVGSQSNQILSTESSRGNVNGDALRKALEDYRRTEQMIWKSFSHEKEEKE